jgi:hypothetical protein
LNLLQYDLVGDYATKVNKYRIQNKGLYELAINFVEVEEGSIYKMKLKKNMEE